MEELVIVIDEIFFTLRCTRKCMFSIFPLFRLSKSNFVSQYYHHRLRYYYFYYYHWVSSIRRKRKRNLWRWMMMKKRPIESRGFWEHSRQDCCHIFKTLKGRQKMKKEENPFEKTCWNWQQLKFYLFIKKLRIKNLQLCIDDLWNCR